MCRTVNPNKWGQYPYYTQNASVALLRMVHLCGLDPLALEVQVLSLVQVLSYSLMDKTSDYESDNPCSSLGRKTNMLKF